MQLVPFDRCEALRISTDVTKKGEVIEFVYQLEGDTSDIVVPPPAVPQRTAGLWKATCFEAFVRTGEKSYVELNFSPSGQWAAYRFSGHREGMSDLDIAPPLIRFEDWRLSASVAAAHLGGRELNLSAVIAFSNGSQTYWALAHPPGPRPDFHAPDCFVAQLP